MYNILLERQIIRLSNDIANIVMGKRMLRKICFFLEIFGQRYLT